MTSSRLARQIEFLREIEKLKSITRANKTLDGRNENSAEHSWHVALMGLLLQEHAAQALDMFKVTRMLLIHDIVEIDAGDTWLYASDQGNKFESETRAAHRLFALLPDNQRDEYLALWFEFEDQSSAEAQFATAIDGIQPLLNHLLTGEVADAVIAAQEVRVKKACIRKYAPALWALVEELIAAGVTRGLYT